MKLKRIYDCAACGGTVTLQTKGMMMSCKCGTVHRPNADLLLFEKDQKDCIHKFKQAITWNKDQHDYAYAYPPYLQCSECGKTKDL